MLKVELDHRAEADLFEVADYYNSQQQGLGQRFLDEFTAAVERIQLYPELYAIVRDAYRSCSMNHFKYRIIYTIDTDIIYILAIMHQKRHPDRWQARLK
jgi:plasmid stabilization system protein ParE